MTTSHDLVSMLRAHYGGTPSKPQPGYFAPEIQAPHSARRADALWLPLQGDQRGQIHGHEIKVSRSDVMVELADPMKAEAWGQFCDRWWLVVSDIALLRDLDVPDSWGIMTPPSGRSKRLMTIVRPAPLRKPNRDRDAYSTVLARIYYGSDGADAKIRFLESSRDRAENRAVAAENRLRGAEQQLRAVGVVRTPADKMVEDRLRTITQAAVVRYDLRENGRRIDWRGVAEVGEMTDDELLDILFETGRARARIREADDLVRDRVRWLQQILDQDELHRLAAELKDGTP